MWVGYDIVGVEADLSHLGYIQVEGWSEEQLAPYGVVTFMEIEPEKLGIERK
jgi:hypothetical protein